MSRKSEYPAPTSIAFPRQVTKSLEGSRARLRLDQVDIFHLQNAITETGGGEALSVQQVLDDVVPAFERPRRARYVSLGLQQSVTRRRCIR